MNEIVKFQDYKENEITQLSGFGWREAMSIGKYFLSIINNFLHKRV
jgi:hypothetical protein